MESRETKLIDTEKRLVVARCVCGGGGGGGGRVGLGVGKQVRGSKRTNFQLQNFQSWGCNAQYGDYSLKKLYCIFKSC